MPCSASASGTGARRAARADDLARWAQEHHYQAAGRSRDVWVNVVDDIADVGEQVFEIQLPVKRKDDGAS